MQSTVLDTVWGIQKKKKEDMVPAPTGAYNLVQETEYIHMK